jgi:molybdopterin converting factor small subunit
MKNVDVRFFAIFREITGQQSFSHHSGASSTRELFEEVCAVFPGLNFDAAALVAINDEMAGWDRSFEDGDVILFFPPVAGG